jgi:hypothetical protein
MKRLHERYVEKEWNDNFRRNIINQDNQTYDNYKLAMNQFDWKPNSSISQHLDKWGIHTKPLTGVQDWGRYFFL